MEKFVEFKDKKSFIGENFKPKVLKYKYYSLKKITSSLKTYSPFNFKENNLLNPDFVFVGKKVTAKRFIERRRASKPKRYKKAFNEREAAFMKPYAAEYSIPKKLQTSIKIKNSTLKSVKSFFVELYDAFNIKTQLVLTLDKYLPKKMAVYITVITFLSLPLLSCSGGSSPVTPKGPDPDPIPVNQAPNAYATVDKDYGEITETFIYNTSGSTDDTSGLQSRIDFDGDGNYDTSYAPIGATNHVYTAGGNMNPSVQVKDLGNKTDTYSLGKVGVLDPANNPITIEIKGPKYIVADEEVTERIEATDINNRPLTYQLNNGSGFVNVGTETIKTFSSNDVGKRTLEAIATNDYKIKNNVTKDVEIGSVVPYDAIVTDKIDGIKYKVKAMDDGRFWIVENFKGEVGTAPCYNDDCDSNGVFGRYYNAAEVDQIGDRVMTLNGVEHTFRVATTNEWDALRNAYNQTTGPLKYKEFSNGENVGATNDGGLSLMLGGGMGSPPENNFDSLEEYGYFYTLVGTGNTSNSRMIRISKDNIIMSRGPPNNGVRAPTRLIKVN